MTTAEMYKNRWSKLYSENGVYDQSEIMDIIFDAQEDCKLWDREDRENLMSDLSYHFWDGSVLRIEHPFQKTGKINLVAIKTYVDHKYC